MTTNRVIIGDAIEKLPELPGGSVDMIWADPPYNQGVDYGCGPSDDEKIPGDYLAWTESWIALAAARLILGGAFWLLINEKWADQVGQLLTFRVGPRINRIIWREKFGQYRTDRFPQGHRHLFLHVRGGRCEDGGILAGSVKHPRLRTWNPDAIGVVSARMEVGDKRAGGPRVPDDVWEVSRLQGNDNERVKGHPCQLRQWPIERAICATTAPGEVVLDPFLGSGTTMVAATKHGRSCIGIELNPEYAALAVTRVAEYAPLFRQATGEAAVESSPSNAD